MVICTDPSNLIRKWLIVSISGSDSKLFYILGVISKIKAAKRYALSKIISNNSKNSNNSTSSLTPTDESSRQRGQTRKYGSRDNLSRSKTVQLKSSSLSSNSESEQDEESSDDEENEEDYKPGT